MAVCLYTWMHIHRNTCVCTCGTTGTHARTTCISLNHAYIHTYPHTYVNLHYTIYMCVCVCMYVYVCVCVCMYICVCVCMCVCVCKSAYYSNYFKLQLSNFEFHLYTLISNVFFCNRIKFKWYIGLNKYYSNIQILDWNDFKQMNSISIKFQILIYINIYIYICIHIYLYVCI